MDGAKILLVEDHGALRRVVAANLQACGHIVVGAAGSFREALSMIDELEPGSIDVAVVDGNLDGQQGERATGSDGSLVIDYLRAREEEIGRVTTIGYSNSQGGVAGADINVRKGDDPNALYDTIQGL